ncbi:hypothetical protein Tco_0938617 [Tanacetum coccineum]|uniref:Uncharacterized protein n=1 Tax=Tanacetum coccineum TaxID=301880 RepID=A0ABQ5DIJ4_9ASTR
MDNRVTYAQINIGLNCSSDFRIGDLLSHVRGECSGDALNRKDKSDNEAGASNVLTSIQSNHLRNGLGVGVGGVGGGLEVIFVKGRLGRGWRGGNRVRVSEERGEEGSRIRILRYKIGENAKGSGVVTGGRVGWGGGYGVFFGWGKWLGGDVGLCGDLLGGGVGGFLDALVGLEDFVGAVWGVGWIVGWFCGIVL